MKISISKLELLMVRRGMNFSQLAKKAAVSRQTISTINGRKTCAATTANKLARALDVPIEALMEEAAL